MVAHIIGVNAGTRTSEFFFKSKAKKELCNAEVQELNDIEYLILNFWANWCNPCKKEMIEINRIRVENDFKNIQFISISIDEFKDIEAAKTFFKTNKIPWKLYFDTKKEFFMKLLEITENSSTAIPISIVLDKKGNIVSFHSGFEQETYKADLLEDIHMIESGN